MLPSLCQRRLGLVVLLTASLAALYGLWAKTTSAPSASVQRWTIDAVGEDPIAAATAIQSLREMGPSGLTAFSAAHADSLDQLRESPACLCAANSPERRLAHALDQIAGQRDAASAGLYWYTDFSQACAAARQQGKPILSLRLLGKLTDELSCANSRFFRTTLYADPKIAGYLRSELILHWQSVRPAPKITVDFGDGRRLERTITGNSVHYLLDSQGRVVDVVPGLYAPQAFLEALRRAVDTAHSLAAAAAGERSELLIRYHENRRAELVQTIANPSGRDERETATGSAAPGGRNEDSRYPILVPKGLAEAPLVRAVTPAALPDIPAQGQPQGNQGSNPYAPPAFSADLDIPVPKGSFERLLVREITSAALPDIPAQGQPQGYASISSLEPEVLDQLAQQILAETKFSPASETLIRAKIAAVPREYLPGPLEEVQATALEKLRKAVAVDTARNEYDFHDTIHGWLSAEPDIDLETLNDRVYAELFRTPRTDPWLGLLNLEAFSAVDACGIVVERSPRQETRQ